MAIFYVDGEFVDAENAALPIADLAILRGYAVFDFLRTYNGRPFHLEEHLRRLKRSAELLQIKFPWKFDEISDIVRKLLKKNNLPESNIRFLITGGESIDSITPLDKPRLIVMVTELKSFPKVWYVDGVNIITTHATRYIPGSKSTNYIKAIMALRNARSEEAIESIYVNEKGHLLEGTTSNIFVVKDGRIITPQSDILEGITRKVVLRLSKEKFIVEENVVSQQDLNEISEMFITSSNKEIVPVVRVDKMQISSSPGPVTIEIMKMFRQYTEQLR